MISRDLSSRLPLRNLNWKSPSRPLRSIGALHVEWVPDSATASASASATTSDDQLYRVESNTAGKERRHQIPGLRQTPYLKVYLLRCDDKDTYKEDSRHLLREWIRDNSSPAQSSTSSNKPENHDASEWVILHVVIPDTIAASEPRWTAASNKDPDELVERPQTSTKWPGKSTRTVLDKIRADFNPSSKSAPERVAQIRPQKNVVPPQFLPKTPAATSPYIETKQEQENAWQDLVSKFKTLILASFALRVAQYEDDIREKDSQRSLPGWNFCTFFTLKEGLARGFESVGLVEDALAIYDELSAGLETAVREDASGPSATNTTFLGDLNMYRDAIQHMANAFSDKTKLENMAQPFQSLLSQPLDLSTEDYRGAIVSSTISLFHFQTYIFARQRTLLLRLGSGGGNVQQPKTRMSSNPPKDTMTFAAEVCRRAAVFAATNARALLLGLKEGYECFLVISQFRVDSSVGLKTKLLFTLTISSSTQSRPGRTMWLTKFLVKQHQTRYLRHLPQNLSCRDLLPAGTHARIQTASISHKEQILILRGVARFNEASLVPPLLRSNRHRKSYMRMSVSASRLSRHRAMASLQPGPVWSILLLAGRSCFSCSAGSLRPLRRRRDG